MPTTPTPYQNSVDEPTYHDLMEPGSADDSYASPYLGRRTLAAFLRDWHNLIWCRDLTLPLCRWCRTPLQGRRTAYCSEQCATLFQENHHWQTAAWACAKRYDGYCADCAVDGKQSRFKWAPERDPNDPRPPWERIWAENPDYSPTEVHHIHPLNGIPRWWSCYNHQSNLVLLCRKCHNARHRLLPPGATEKKRQIEEVCKWLEEIQHSAHKEG